MGSLKYLILHCSATPEGRDITPTQIETMHKAKPPVGHGWDKVGYSKFFKLDGSVHEFVHVDDDEKIDPWEVTYGAGALNAVAVHWCYAGGMSKDMKAPKDTRTLPQKHSLEVDIKAFLQEHPQAKVCGHYHFANKACPSFDVAKFCREIGIPEVNIYTPVK